MKRKKFKIPECVSHKETKDVINSMIAKLEENGTPIAASDFPQFHRMATAYDLYLTCTDIIAANGPTMENLKGEMVKRPEINIMKENWSQFLEISKEYGLTAKSGKVLKLGDPEKNDTPLDKYFKEIR